MAIFTISPVIPDLRVFRAWPCTATVDWDTECGATPASLYRLTCGVVEHTREVWLCPVHASMAACGGAICKGCASRGGIRQVLIQRLTEPLRFG